MSVNFQSNIDQAQIIARQLEEIIRIEKLKNSMTEERPTTIRELERLLLNVETNIEKLKQLQKT
jgi:hypothetical protein